ncbi:MAG: phenylalanine--tRNA ligase subunit alpha, partial [Cyanobacteria bacterium]|nr:phenylalanine--tRNA ligase subunit alpha [Cyanobacteriota bacterium]
MTVDELEKNLKKLEGEALQAVGSVADLTGLEEIRIVNLGKKGSLTEILRGLGKLTDPTEKQRVGSLANSVKESIQKALDVRKEALEESALFEKLALERVDVTLPGTRGALGHIHPLTRMTEEIERIFYAMGFSTVEGPEVETDYYNFDALNTPDDHPARDE